MYIVVKFIYVWWRLVEIFFNRWVVDTSLYWRKSYRRYLQFILLRYIHTMNRGVSLINVRIFNWKWHQVINIFKQGTVSISNFLKPSLQELLGPIFWHLVLGHSLSRILIALFWIMKTYLTDEYVPQKIIP